MATKPTTLPEWASSPTADVAEPTTGRKQLGHVHGESPTAQEENWYKRTVYRWAEYLRDGALSGAHTIAGALTATTVTSTGNTTVGGDAAIVGTVTAADLETTGPIVAGADLSVAGDVNITAGGDVVLTGSGRVRRLAAGLTFVPVVGYGSGSIAYDSAGHYVLASGASSWLASVPLRDHVKITGVEVEVWGNGSAITVDAIIAAASGSNLVASASASPGSGWTTITVTEASILANWGPTRQTITPPDAMLLKITIAASGARIRRCSILCDES